MAKDPKADAAADAEAPAANPKKKMIMIIVAVLVLAIGGGAGWYFMQPKDDHKKVEKHGDEHEEDGEHGDEEDEEHGDEEEDEDEPEEDGHAAAPVFVPLETFTVNLQPDPDERFLQLDISLQFKNEAHAEKIKAHMPAIRNRILMLLSSKQASEINTLEGKQHLTEALLEEVKKPFKKHGKKQKVQGVFFTSFVIQ